MRSELLSWTCDNYFYGTYITTAHYTYLIKKLKVTYWKKLSGLMKLSCTNELTMGCHTFICHCGLQDIFSNGMIPVLLFTFVIWFLFVTILFYLPSATLGSFSPGKRNPYTGFYIYISFKILSASALDELIF